MHNLIKINLKSLDYRELVLFTESTPRGRSTDIPSQTLALRNRKYLLLPGQKCMRSHVLVSWKYKLQNESENQSGFSIFTSTANLSDSEEKKTFITESVFKLLFHPCIWLGTVISVAPSVFLGSVDQYKLFFNLYKRPSCFFFKSFFLSEVPKKKMKSQKKFSTLFSVTVKIYAVSSLQKLYTNNHKNSASNST